MTGFFFFDPKKVEILTKLGSRREEDKGLQHWKKKQGVLLMLTRKDLAKRWKTTPRTIDRRRSLGLLPWVDLAKGVGKRPQIRFLLHDVQEYERRARLAPEEGTAE